MTPEKIKELRHQAALSAAKLARLEQSLCELKRHLMSVQGLPVTIKCLAAMSDGNEVITTDDEEIRMVFGMFGTFGMLTWMHEHATEKLEELVQLSKGGEE